MNKSGKYIIYDCFSQIIIGITQQNIGYLFINLYSRIKLVSLQEPEIAQYHLRTMLFTLIKKDIVNQTLFAT